MNWTLGLIFSISGQNVVLITKENFEPHKGLLNGIGGEIKEGETIQGCMERECKEETGMVIPADNWQHFLTLEVNGHNVECLRVFTENVWDHKTVTNEAVKLYKVAGLRSWSMVPNLNWIMQMALDKNVTNAKVTSK